MCPEDMRMFRFTSGKQDGQKDKVRERQKDRQSKAGKRRSGAFSKR